MIYLISFLFKQKTAYEMRISDWSSDVCSSDLQNLPFDPATDFTPVSMIGQVPLVIGARPDMPAESPQEFFDYLKANPGTLNYGATGVGSIQHFAGELLNQALGTDVQVVQYPGGGPAMTDVMGSHIEYSIGSMPQMLPQIRASNIKPSPITHASPHGAETGTATSRERGCVTGEIQGGGGKCT